MEIRITITTKSGSEFSDLWFERILSAMLDALKIGFENWNKKNHLGYEIDYPKGSNITKITKY